MQKNKKNHRKEHIFLCSVTFYSGCVTRCVAECNWKQPITCSNRLLKQVTVWSSRLITWHIGAFFYLSCILFFILFAATMLQRALRCPAWWKLWSMHPALELVACLEIQYRMYEENNCQMCPLNNPGYRCNQWEAELGSLAYLDRWNVVKWRLLLWLKCLHIIKALSRLHVCSTSVFC